MKDSKKLNVVLCSLVLVFALASAVLSFFLFNKREALVSNSTKLVETVTEVAGNLDANSGTTVASRVTADTIAATAEPTAVDSALIEVKKQSKDVIAQRDAFAVTLHAIGNELSAGVKSANDFKSTKSYKSELAKINVAKIKGLKEQALRESKKAKAAVDSEKRMRSTVNGLNQKIRSLDSSLKNRERELAAARKKASNLQAQVSKQNNKIAEYERMLGISSGNRLMDAGSEEVLKKLTGSVTKVNEELGYITIDLGTDSAYKQVIGKKVFNVNYNLKKGVDLLVCRGDKFIAEISLNELGATESTANIPVEKAGMIKVGDKVIWKSAK